MVMNLIVWKLKERGNQICSFLTFYFLMNFVRNYISIQIIMTIMLQAMLSTLPIVFISFRVCIVCLAPSHVLLNEFAGEILSVDYQIGNIDRRKNQVSGKRKNKSLFF